MGSHFSSLQPHNNSAERRVSVLKTPCFFQMMNDAEKEDEKKEEAEKTQMLQELHNLDVAVGDGDDISKLVL